jgi:hypothetical protein
MNTIIERSKPDVIPQQVRRSLRGVLAFPLPSGTQGKNFIPPEYEVLGRTLHGDARTFESLRGLRLLVVPQSG